MNCGILDLPSNGQVISSGTTFKIEAMYVCDEGFQLIGNGTRMCQANGMWSGNEPECEGMYVPCSIIIQDHDILASKSKVIL